MEKKISPAKVVVLGEGKQFLALKAKAELMSVARVGKTSLTYRFAHGVFNEHQVSTVDATCIEKKINIQDKQIKLVIWDTAG